MLYMLRGVKKNKEHFQLILVLFLSILFLRKTLKETSYTILKFNPLITNNKCFK